MLIGRSPGFEGCRVSLEDSIDVLASGAICMDQACTSQHQMFANSVECIEGYPETSVVRYNCDSATDGDIVVVGEMKHTVLYDDR